MCEERLLGLVQQVVKREKFVVTHIFTAKCHQISLINKPNLLKLR